MNKRKSGDNEGGLKKFKPNSIIQRPPVTQLDPTKDTLIFQELELDHYVSSVYPGMPGPQLGQVPIIRMFGVTKEGNSVCCHVHGFSPYFYVNLPSTFTNNDLAPFKEQLNNALIADIRGGNREGVTDAVLMVEIVKGKSLVEYQGDEDEPFAKVTLCQHKFVPAAKRLLSSQVIYKPLASHSFQFFESNVDIETRFMVDNNILGCVWIELPPKKWYLRTSLSQHTKISRCQIECDVSYEDFIAHAPEGDWGDVAQFRIHSFDIECAGRKGVFPEPNVDPVIQIANVIQLHGVREVMIRNIFCLKSCAPIGHAEVYCYEKEEEMLEAWARFVRELDPDIFTGYNINNFDFPYLLERAKHLKVANFDLLGRLVNVRSQIKETTTQTKIGKRVYKTINFEGRVPYDMLLVTKRDFKLRSYTLNSVCQEILGEQKEDVHYSIITDLQNGDEQTRRRLAVYCLKDAELPMRLINTVLSFTNDIEMARVTGVAITSLLTKGEQVKVVAQLLRHARKAGYFMPAHQGTAGQDQYEGATVIEPIRGYYTDPIATLDFSSLYPSIMIAHNLCYTTLIKSVTMKDKLGLTNDQVTTTPVNCLFVKSSVRPGLLPHILQHLLAARKKTKTLLKDAKDPMLKAVLNGRQLAYKISANSVYGFTGAQVGKLPCLEISGSVTAYGRSMIEQTKQEVEQHYTVQNGYETDAKVIYGDTDSVMVNFKVKDIERSMELGREAAELISTKFIKPIKLEFEKVYYPYLLINKKRYAGLYFTRPDKYDKMDCKGIETVRRDNCTLVCDVINTCLQKLLIDRDPGGAVNYAKQVISDLLQNNIDISQLVITKELTKEDYQAKQAHVELSKKMKKRDPGNAPKLGDRIPYVITAATKNAKAFEKAEDPIYVLENNIPIDAKYYLENQLSKPLVRIFQPILGDNAESILLRGEHTRTRTVVTSKVGALSAFTQKKETCLGCKSVLPKGYENEAVCSYCKPKESYIYQQELCHHGMLENRFADLFTDDNAAVNALARVGANMAANLAENVVARPLGQVKEEFDHKANNLRKADGHNLRPVASSGSCECQRCQGSLHEEILCTSRDCPIFYIRKKVQMELATSKTKIERFGDPVPEEEEEVDQDMF